MSAFTGFVLYLCQDLSCLMTGSRVWYFVLMQRTLFLCLGEKCFEFHFLREVYYPGGLYIKYLFDCVFLV